MGEYYYLETVSRKQPFKMLHRRGCFNLSSVRGNAAFLGTFYRTADALLTAKKIYRDCVICPYCCTKKDT